MWVLFSCANIGSPNGGPYDEAPPKYVSSNPLPLQKNYTGKKVEIVFDELIQLEKPSENVIITPPQMETPVIKTVGKKVVVELKDSLKENTTYTIDFTNSLSDNNEKNVLENYTFSFSTGDIIDSLEISGIVLNAENLEPMSGITVGIHSNLEDSAFVSLSFDRTSRTNERGRFTIRNVAPGSYRVYALNDVNRDYRFDQPGEEIAFWDSIIVPSAIGASRIDTLWKDSLTIDTIKTVDYTRYLPDDITLMLFKEDFSRQYMSKPERPDQKYFTLKFNAPLDTLPSLRPINFDIDKDEEWFVTQRSEDLLSVNYWMKDSLVYQKDTLELEITYPKSDSLNILCPQTDTVSVVMKHNGKVQPKKKSKDDKPEPVEHLSLQSNASGTINIYDTISVVFGEPIANISKETFVLEEKVDSLYNIVDFDFFVDSLNPMKFYINRKWNYEQEFSLRVDSGVVESLYGKTNNTFDGKFKIKKEDEYGHLYININGLADSCAFVELLSSSDAVVRRSPVKDGGALFMDLKPDKYFARLIIDSNCNGKWDTGKYDEKRHAEQVYYSPKKYDVPQNWQVEETWDISVVPFDKQKPLEVTKNKPKEVTKQKRNYKDEGQRSSSSSSSGLKGLSF
jgi:hypothetical protein